MRGDDTSTTAPPSSDSPREFPYDVVITFAGEDRRYVRLVNHALKAEGITTFYDQDRVAESAGEDLPAYLYDVFCNKGRFCLVFASKHYQRKAAPNHELKGARHRQMRQPHEPYIIPVILDDAIIEGVTDAKWHINARRGRHPRALDEIVDSLFHRLGRPRHKATPSVASQPSADAPDVLLFEAARDVVEEPDGTTTLRDVWFYHEQASVPVAFPFHLYYAVAARTAGRLGLRFVGPPGVNEDQQTQPARAGRLTRGGWRIPEVEFPLYGEYYAELLWNGESVSRAPLIIAPNGKTVMRPRWPTRDDGPIVQLNSFVPCVDAEQDRNDPLRWTVSNIHSSLHADQLPVTMPEFRVFLHAWLTRPALLQITIRRRGASARESSVAEAVVLAQPLFVGRVDLPLASFPCYGTFDLQLSTAGKVVATHPFQVLPTK